MQSMKMTRKKQEILIVTLIIEFSCLSTRINLPIKDEHFACVVRSSSEYEKKHHHISTENMLTKQKNLRKMFSLSAKLRAKMLIDNIGYYVHIILICVAICE